MRFMPVSCEVCGHKCRDNFNLKRHLLAHKKKVSREMKKEEIVARRKKKCRLCSKTLPDTATAFLHKGVCEKRLICFHCGRKLHDKKTVRKHIEKFHLFQNSSKVPGPEHLKKRCGLCSFHCFSMSEIERHLEVDHQLHFEEEFKTFDNQEDFLNWKESFELETKSLYVKMRGSRSTRVDRLTVNHFYCHRNGNARIKPSSSRKRSIKVLGSNKTGSFCPARMRVQLSDDGKVFLSGFYTHIGHDFCSGRLPLKKSFRAQIASELLAKNVPFREIILQNKERVPENGVVTRESLLSTKDLHNIYRDRQSLLAYSSGSSFDSHPPSSVFQISLSTSEEMLGILMKEEPKREESPGNSRTRDA